MKNLHLIALIALALHIAPAAVAQNTQPRTDPQPAREETGKEMSDTWITTKVKSALLADEDVSGLEIDVETHAGVVTLRGIVKQQSEIDEARRIAQNIDGVKRVDIQHLKRDKQKP